MTETGFMFFGQRHVADSIFQVRWFICGFCPGKGEMFIAQRCHHFRAPEERKVLTGQRSMTHFAPLEGFAQKVTDQFETNR